MKTAAMGLMFGVGVALVFCLVSPGTNSAYAQRAAVSSGGANDLTAVSSTTNDGRQVVTVVDGRARVMSVYHVDPTSGVISLKSVRNLQWDFQLGEFNAAKPFPQELRALLEQR